MIKKAITLLLLILAVYWSFLAMMPSKISDVNTAENKFSTERALVHLKEISKAPHYVGSEEHTQVRQYIINELKALGLQVELQETFSLTGFGNLSKPKNIIARIPGSNNSKSLVLLSHYDSAPQASLGASDAGSGVVTIIEGIRAYLSEGKTPKNDIIIVITDSEELGLNGADTFVNKHPWAKDVGLVLNFEARGSGGPSYMLMETNKGNANLMKAFVAADPEYPVANSLVYSIYKMLPNDTDLTIFREDGDIEGFNFAFIDDHYDYHTIKDNYERLDRNTLEHQGSYLMPLLHYFSEADLSNLKTEVDYVYFNMPMFKMVMYPFAWIWPMFIVAVIIFVALIVYGVKKERLHVKEMLLGFLPFLSGIIASGFAIYALWQLMLWMYPQYNDMLHGFTYNGHTYISAFVFLMLGLCFWFYHRFYKTNNTSSLLVAPIFFWLIICGLVAAKLQGASFFIIPVYGALLALFVLIRQKEPNLVLLGILCAPMLLILAPFITMLPIGLGLKMLFIVGVLGALMFGLLIPVFGFYKHKNRLSYVSLGISLVMLISAHFKSGFNEDNAKPNSLVYVLNEDNNTAKWATYDKVLDDWTKNFLGDNPTDATTASDNTFASKYGSRYSYVKEAPLKKLESPKINFQRDTVIGDFRYISMSIVQQRQINRLDLYADKTHTFKDFTVNGVEVEKKNDFAFKDRNRSRLFTYYISDNDSLNLEFSVPKEQKTKFQMFESSFDLLTNEMFTVPEREADMIPKPFILNDAIIITKSIDIN